MKDEMILNISTLMLNDDSPEAQTIRLMVPGKAYQRGSSFYILYTEEDTRNGEIINIRVKVKNGVVELNRKSQSGAYTFVLDEGKECKTTYNTIYGDFGIAVKGKKIVFRRWEEDQKFQLQMSYEMYMESKRVGEYFVVMENAQGMINDRREVQEA